MIHCICRCSICCQLEGASTCRTTCSAWTMVKEGRPLWQQRTCSGIYVETMNIKWWCCRLFVCSPTCAIYRKKLPDLIGIHQIIFCFVFPMYCRCLGGTFFGMLMETVQVLVMRGISGFCLWPFKFTFACPKSFFPCSVNILEVFFHRSLFLKNIPAILDSFLNSAADERKQA